MDISDLMLIYKYDPEKDRINMSYIEEVVARLTKVYYEKWNNEGRISKERDIVINMYKSNETIDKISKYTELPIKKIKQIIDNYLKNNKKI